MYSNKMFKKPAMISVLLIVVITMAFQNKPGKQGEWQNLFDGKTLKGWKIITQNFKNQKGKPDFHVENNMIVCNTTLDNGGGYLVTEKSYSNFIIEFDVKCDTSLNSGLQFRSHVWEKDTTTIYEAGIANGKTRQITSKRRAGEVWGYQIEIDPSKRAWSGGLYEQGYRGWIVTLAGKEAARKAFKPLDWNHFKVIVNGNKIQSWVNNVLAADTTDNMSSSGYIGLQMHPAEAAWQNNKKSMWKNIKIQELK